METADVRGMAGDTLPEPSALHRIPAPAAAARRRMPESTMAERIAFPELEPGGCRWIVGDPRKEWRWCGAEAAGTYCDAHKAMASMPAPPPPTAPTKRRDRVQIDGVVVTL
jgi:hypothetical protein